MKKFLCLLLALMMVVSMAACADSGDDEKDTKSGNSTTQEEETGDPRYECELPGNLNYGGDTVTILYSIHTGRADEVYAEHLTQAIINDAVYERNDIVKNRLNIDFAFESDDDAEIVTKLTNDVKAGAHAFDIIINASHVSMTPAINGNYLDLNKLEYIDTSKHYWTQGYNDMVTFTDENRQFLASGPIALSMFRLMYLTVYNKTEFEAQQEKDLYDVVMNNEWSLDYQYKIMTGKYVDLDGDNKKSKGDSFGFVSGNCVSVDPYMVASDLHFVIKDPDTSDLIFNADVLDTLSDLVTKTQLIFNDQGAYIWNSSTEDDVGLNNIIETFCLGHTMMATIIFWNMEHNFSDLAAMTYGIAPIPKFSAEQPAYHSYVQDQVSSIGISAGIGDESRQSELSAVLEAMAYHSYLKIRPAYYENTLSSRYMQDPESAVILELIFDSLDFDLASTCSAMLSVNTRDTLRNHFGGKKNTIASSTRSWQKSITKGLEKTNDKLAQMD